jgi:membrane protease YdiL (CAAX protease family)
MSAIVHWVRRHPLVTYVVLTYAISWSCWLPLVVSGSIVHQGDGWPTDLPGLMGPALAAAITLGLTGGRGALTTWARRMAQVRVPWWCFAFVAVTVALGFGSESVLSGRLLPAGVSAYTGAPDLGLVLTFVVVLVVNGFGEEAGWRGFLVDRLLDRHGLVRTASIVAVVWAGWHLPLFLVLDSFRGLGVAAGGWLIGLYAGSIVLTWLYAAGRRSIFLVALWHTAYNFTSATSAMNGVPAAVTSSAVMVVAAIVLTVSFRNRTPRQEQLREVGRLPAA